MLRGLRLFAVGLVSVLVVASPADAMIGGTADGNAHPYVVGVADPDGGGVVFTGTVISPTVVLTVAHGVTRLEQATGSDQAGVTLDSVVSQSSTWYTGTIHIDPDFNPNVPGAGDYAVIVFDTPLPVTPAALPTQNMLSNLGQPLLRSTSFPVIGYGLTRLLPHSPNPDFSSGGTRNVDAATFQGLKPQLLKLQMPGGDQVCVGDSGAPSTLGTSNTITGITLGALGGCISSGTATQMRVDTAAARSFIGHYVTLP